MTYTIDARDVIKGVGVLVLIILSLSAITSWCITTPLRELPVWFILSAIFGDLFLTVAIPALLIFWGLKLWDKNPSITLGSGCKKDVGGKSSSVGVPKARVVKGA